MAKGNKTKYRVKLLMDDSFPITITLAAKNNEDLHKQINNLNGVQEVLSINEKVVKLSLFNPNAETFGEIKVGIEDWLYV